MLIIIWVIIIHLSVAEGQMKNAYESNDFRKMIILTSIEWIEPSSEL